MPQTFQMLRSFRSLLGSFSQTVGGHSLLPPTRQPSSDSGFPETFLHVPTTAGPCYCRRKLLVAGKRGGRREFLTKERREENRDMAAARSSVAAGATSQREDVDRHYHWSALPPLPPPRHDRSTGATRH
nr:hypothetical protein Itr_chr15CG00050 [Ipomoea trifida]